MHDVVWGVKENTLYILLLVDRSALDPENCTQSLFLNSKDPVMWPQVSSSTHPQYVSEDYAMHVLYIPPTNASPPGTPNLTTNSLTKGS